jgi:hypothetical protein
VVCIKTGGYVDLEPLKVYKVRRDAAALAQHLLRVVDGSGEDYLYPADFFQPIIAAHDLFKAVEMEGSIANGTQSSSGHANEHVVVAEEKGRKKGTRANKSGRKKGTRVKK